MAKGREDVGGLVVAIVAIVAGGEVVQRLNAANPAGAPASPGNGGGTSGGSAGGGSGVSAQLAAMERANPNFATQATSWRMLRCQNIENPNDWPSFRAFQTGIGAPDPGSQPPAEWPFSFGGPLGACGGGNEPLGPGANT